MNQHQHLDPQSSTYQHAVQTAIETEELLQTVSEVVVAQVTKSKDPVFKVTLNGVTKPLYEGTAYPLAIDHFRAAKIQSKGNFGEAAGKDVSLMEDNEVILHHHGAQKLTVKKS